MKAVITGSSRGLGKAIASKLALEGHDVVITSRSQDSANKVVEEIKSIAPTAEVIGMEVDFSSAENVTSFCKNISAKWNKIDILVNNVGMFVMDRISEDIENNLSKLLDVNLMSAVRTTKGLLPTLKSSGKGVIINVVSIAAKDLRADSASYSLSKLALKGYSDLLREELKQFGIKVVALYPGPMNTSSWDEDQAEKSMMIQMDDMTNAILNLINLSDNAMVEELVIDLVKDL